jgi:hypothetical protein
MCDTSLLTAGCETKRSFAAALIDPVSMTARKTSMCLSLKRIADGPQGLLTQSYTLREFWHTTKLTLPPSIGSTDEALAQSRPGTTVLRRNSVSATASSLNFGSEP